MTILDDYALGGALRQLVADRALRKTLGVINRDFARSSFDERAMISHYAALYDRVLGRGVHFASAAL